MSEKNQVKEIHTTLGNSNYFSVSFDCTGSMSSCIAQVRRQLRDLVEMMTKDLPDMKIALIAHGDYCDGERCITTLDFTNDIEKLMNFITDVPNVSGGDFPECYEYVLHKAQELSWTKDGGTLLMIGDAIPHPAFDNPFGLDWQTEAKKLKAKNVKVFGMQCPHAGPEANLFWEQLSGEGETPLLILESFNDSTDVLGAVAYATAGKDALKDYKFNLCDVSMNKSANVMENLTKLEKYTTEKE